MASNNSENRSKLVATYVEAEAHATASYWVEPIQIENEQQQGLFYQNFRAADHSESGKVHYARRATHRERKAK